MKSEYINCKNCKDDCRCRGKNITPICVSFNPVKTTDADCIRTMSDEELARFITGEDFCELLCKNSPSFCNGDCENWMLLWLKAPVEVQDG